MVAPGRKGLFVVRKSLFVVNNGVARGDVNELQRLRRDRVEVLPWGFTRRTGDAVDRLVRRATDRLVVEMTVMEDWTP